jgi:hypothetical protein
MVRFINFMNSLVPNGISEGSTHGQTDIYYIPPSHWIAGGIKICAVSNFINTGKKFGRGGDLGFF